MAAVASSSERNSTKEYRPAYKHPHPFAHTYLLTGSAEDIKNVMCAGTVQRVGGATRLTQCSIRLNTLYWVPLAVQQKKWYELQQLCESQSTCCVHPDIHHWRVGNRIWY